MASFFKHKGSGFYYLKVKRNGKWVQEPTRIRIDGVGAARKVRRLAIEETAKETDAPVQGWGWIPQFLRTQYGGSPRTLARYAAAWTAIEVFFKERGVFGPGDVTHAMCQAYATWRSDGASLPAVNWNTALAELRVLSRMMTEAVHRGIVRANPCLRMGLKRRNTHIKPEITPKEQEIIEKALRKAPQWMRDCWTIGMCQGLRLNECNCPLDRIDMQLGTISVIGKGGRVHTAPLHPAVREIAQRAKEEGRVTLLGEYDAHNASAVWSEFFDRIKLPHLTFHSTRVTVVTRLARSGASRARAMAYVGHASSTVHEIYLRLSAPDVADLGEVLRVGSMKG